MTKLEIAIQYAKTFIGKPYIWGGDDPILGFDCSGLVQEILASIGMDPPGDQTAQGLYYYFRDKRNGFEGVDGPGCLYFFGLSIQEITHVGFGIDCPELMLEAGGGGSKSVNAAKAAELNAYVRIRPCRRRNDLVAVVLPRYV